MFNLKYINDYPISFLIASSELEGRFDPYFYNSDLQKFTSLKNTSIKRIREVILSVKSGFGVGRENQSDEQDGILQIRPTNLDSNGILKFDRNIYIPKELINNDNQLCGKDDVLFNNTNSQDLVGKTALFERDDKLAFSNHITVLKVNKTQILPKYLWLVLNIYQRHKIFFSICTNWNNQSGVGLDLLKSLKIPVPILAQQEKIISIWDKAFLLSKHKEEKARELLASIDNYLLNELSIKLPAKDNSLTNRIFTTSLRKISGNRIDPKIYSKHSQSLIVSIDKSRFPITALKNIIVHSASGDWGNDENNIDDDYEKCLVIRATEFDNNFNLNLSNDRLKYRQIRKEKLAQLDIKVNDLLIEKSGGSPDQPVGRIAILTTDILSGHKICYSNFIHKIRIDEAKIIPEYLFSFLKTIHNIKITDLMQSQTSGIRNLIMHEYFNQSIVIPEDKKVQMKISDKANKMREDARILFVQANEELEEARQRVEKIILEEK